MKKQQMVSFPGKKLSRNEMKNLPGGTVAALGIWVCTADYDCFGSLSACRLYCSNKNGCKAFSYCP
jgi:hypothetical protein